MTEWLTTSREPRRAQSVDHHTFNLRVQGSSYCLGKVDLLGFPGSHSLKDSPVIQERWVQSLGQEDPLEKETNSSILAWRIPWTEESGGLQSIGSQELNMTY